MVALASGPVRAQVWTEGQGFKLHTWDSIDEIANPGNAVAVIDRALVCGSDVHTVLGRRSSPSPSVLGHEAVGRIVVLPSARSDVNGTPLSVGDRVVWSVTASCGECDRCARGMTAKCRRLLKTGHEKLTGPWPLSGGYATHIELLPGLALVKVPPTVSDNMAAMSACALGTVMACIERASELAGRRVLVLGAGMLGVCAIAVAKRRGAKSITAVDTSDDRRRLALRVGADQAFAPGELASLPPSEGIGERPGGGGFDVIIELSGAHSSVQSALHAGDIGATIVLAGSVATIPPVSVDAEAITRSWTRVCGVHNYEPRHLAEAIDFCAQPGFEIEELFAPPIPLADLPEVFEHGPTPGVLRHSVTPNAGSANSPS